MIKTILSLGLILGSHQVRAELNGIPGNTVTLVSFDSPYTPTGQGKHNFRYRAIFQKDLSNEIPGSLIIEKIQMPDAIGSPYKSIWKQIFDPSKQKNIAEKFKALSFESKLGCCDYSKIAWDSAILKFRISIGGKEYSCQSTDVTKGEPVIECK